MPKKPAPLTAAQALATAKPPGKAKPPVKEKASAVKPGNVFETEDFGDLTQGPATAEPVVKLVTGKRTKAVRSPRKGLGLAVRERRAWALTAFATSLIVLACFVLAAIFLQDSHSVPEVVQVLWAITLAVAFVLFIVAIGSVIEVAREDLPRPQAA